LKLPKSRADIPVWQPVLHRQLSHQRVGKAANSLRKFCAEFIRLVLCASQHHLLFISLAELDFAVVSGFALFAS
jgi:hypothetical protein